MNTEYMRRIDAQATPLLCRFVETGTTLRPDDQDVLEYGLTLSPLGPLLAVWREEQLCRLEFAADLSAPPAPPPPSAVWQENNAKACALIERIFGDSSGLTAIAPRVDSGPPLPLLLRGSSFHLAVWRALLEVPCGHTLSYGALARKAGRPGAARAVGTAMARNPIVYLVPCHRVVRADGGTGHYGGGAELKARLLAWEKKKLSPDSAGTDVLSPIARTFSK